jgi:hypothetical protein
MKAASSREDRYAHTINKKNENVCVHKLTVQMQTLAHHHMLYRKHIVPHRMHFIAIWTKQGKHMTIRLELSTRQH